MMESAQIKDCKKRIWKTITKLYNEDYDQVAVIKALQQIVKEETKDHKETYSCDCLEK